MLRAITVPELVLRSYVGVYQVEPQRTMTVTFEDGQLHCQLTGDGKFPIAAETETRFFPVPFEAQFEFRKEKGKVTGLVLRHGDHENFARRVD